METKNCVTIKGEKFKVKNTLRALFVFEQISGKAFSVETSLDNFLYLYSVILANNPDKPIGWEEFIDALDAEPGIIDLMNTILKNNDGVEKLLQSGEEGAEGEKKN